MLLATSAVTALCSLLSAHCSHNTHRAIAIILAALDELLASIGTETDSAPWVRSDFRCTATSQLATVAQQLIALVPELAQPLSNLALDWLPRTSDSHMQIRLMQIFVALRQPIDARPVAYLLSIFSKHFGSKLDEVALEVLHSFNTMIGYATVKELSQLPQLLWTAATLLYSEHQDEVCCLGCC
jgi:hypothetical protein